MKQHNLDISPYSPNNMHITFSGKETMPNKDNAICYLCGKIIDRKLKNNPMELSMDHVPPKQFFPKQIRETQNLNLNSASSHRICNESYKNDEEYFYHSLYPIVATNNPQMGRLCEQDIQRRAEKPQSHRIIQQILSTKAPTTEGGIYLPPGLSRFTLIWIATRKNCCKDCSRNSFLSNGTLF